MLSDFRVALQCQYLRHAHVQNRKVVSDMQITGIESASHLQLRNGQSHLSQECVYSTVISELHTKQENNATWTTTLQCYRKQFFIGSLLYCHQAQFQSYLLINVKRYQNKISDHCDVGFSVMLSHPRGVPSSCGHSKSTRCTLLAMMHQYLMGMTGMHCLFVILSLMFFLSLWSEFR